MFTIYQRHSRLTFQVFLISMCMYCWNSVNALKEHHFLSFRLYDTKAYPACHITLSHIVLYLHYLSENNNKKDRLEDKKWPCHVQYVHIRHCCYQNAVCSSIYHGSPHQSLYFETYIFLQAFSSLSTVDKLLKKIRNDLVWKFGAKCLQVVNCFVNFPLVKRDLSDLKVKGIYHKETKPINLFIDYT